MKILRWYLLALAFVAPLSFAFAADSFFNYNDPSGFWQRFKSLDNGDGTFSLSVFGGAGRVAYSFATGPITSFAASATDGLVVGGSATKTVRITKLSVCGTATAAATIDVKLITRAAADTAGTAVAATGVPHDSTNAAVSATVNTYTANPTINSTVGNIDVKKLNLGTASGQAGCLFWQFGDTNGQSVVLRGVAQQLALNYNGVTLPAGASIDYKVEETEE